MICLTRDELFQISGYRRPSSIGKWLRESGFIFLVAADGWPRVDKAHYSARMGTATSATLKASKPNFAALKEMQHDRRTSNTKC